MKTNKSQGHVEMILSFVLFAGFFLFVFFIINPFFETNYEESASKIEEGIIENITTKVGRLSIVVNSNDDCYDKNMINNSFGNDFIEYLDVFNDSNNRSKFTLIFGDFLDDPLIGNVSCMGKAGRNHTMGNYYEEKIVNYKLAQQLKENYKSDYAGLKTKFDVNDFVFNFTDLSRNQIYYYNDSLESLGVERKAPENRNVFSSETIIRTIDGNANYYEMILNIKVW